MSDETKIALVKSWLFKAQRDLKAARRLSAGQEPYLDTAIYHCQQAAEKAVKGFLVFHDQRFEKTHDIEALIELALPYDKRFSSCLNAADTLTPYATAYRYPGDPTEPTAQEFGEALKAAEEIYSFVTSSLPDKTYPSMIPNTEDDI